MALIMLISLLHLLDSHDEVATSLAAHFNGHWGEELSRSGQTFLVFDH